MVDIKYIRENLDEFVALVAKRRAGVDVGELVRLDDGRKQLLSEIEQQRAEINAISAGGRPSDQQIERVRQIKEKLKNGEARLAEVETEIEVKMIGVPNLLAPDTPEGESEADNVEVYSWGDKPKFDFQPKDHIELGKLLDIVDFERGAKVGGYRGYYLKNEGVKLALGLMMFALNKLISKGYTPMIPPTLVKAKPLFGSGYFKGLDYDDSIDEIYQVASGDKEADGETSKERKFLVGTAEPSLLAYYSDEVVEGELPIRLAGFSQCYRSEIGSYGKDTKGLYRVHEFMKVEQVVLAKADIETANQIQAEMVEISQELHQELGLPYRVLRICLGDLSLGKYKQFDLEAWMPGLNRYGETGSASNFLDWQARRLNVRYQEDGFKKHVFMLNNTALATPRTIIAILENFQQKDGRIKIPDVLIPYTGFEEIIPK